MLRSTALSLAHAGIMLWFVGCTSYRQVDVRSAPAHEVVSIITVTGDRHEFREPELAGDSLCGRPRVPGRIGGPVWSDSFVAIPLADVASVRVREPSEASTAALIFGGVLLTGLLVYAIAEAPIVGPES